MKEHLMEVQQVYQRVTSSAKAHGEDSCEPDHEVGDLQQALFVALSLLDSDGLSQFRAEWEAVNA